MNAHEPLKSRHTLKLHVSELLDFVTGVLAFGAVVVMALVLVASAAIKIIDLASIVAASLQSG